MCVTDDATRKKGLARGSAHLNGGNLSIGVFVYSSAGRGAAVANDVKQAPKLVLTEEICHGHL
jgi:hypothetical protein